MGEAVLPTETILNHRAASVPFLRQTRCIVFVLPLAARQDIFDQSSKRTAFDQQRDSCYAAFKCARICAFVWKSGESVGKQIMLK